jgi:hypothetical protein
MPAVRKPREREVPGSEWQRCGSCHCLRLLDGASTTRALSDAAAQRLAHCPSIGEQGRGIGGRDLPLATLGPYSADERGEPAASPIGLTGVELSLRTAQRREQAALDRGPQPLDGVDQVGDGRRRPVERDPARPTGAGEEILVDVRAVEASASDGAGREVGPVDAPESDTCRRRDRRRAWKHDRRPVRAMRRPDRSASRRRGRRR